MTHGLEHTRPPCPLQTPRVYSNSCPASDAIQPSHPLSAEAEDRISEVEDRMVEINEAERKKKKELKEMKITSGTSGTMLNAPTFEL